MNNSLTPLDVLTVLIAILNVENYVENEEQSFKIEAHFLEQNKILDEILERLKRLEEK